MKTEKQERNASAGTQSSQRVNTRKFPESSSWAANWEGNALSDTQHETDRNRPAKTDAAPTEES